MTAQKPIQIEKVGYKNFTYGIENKPLFKQFEKSTWRTKNKLKKTI